MNESRQAVITGLGIVSPVGIGTETFWTNAIAGKPGVGHATLFDTTNLPRPCQVVGEVKDFETKDWIGGVAGRMAARFSQFAVAASKMAVREGGLDEDRIPSKQ